MERTHHCCQAAQINYSRQEELTAFGNSLHAKAVAEALLKLFDSCKNGLFKAVNLTAHQRQVKYN